MSLKTCILYACYPKHLLCLLYVYMLIGFCLLHWKSYHIMKCEVIYACRLLVKLTSANNAYQDRRQRTRFLIMVYGVSIWQINVTVRNDKYILKTRTWICLHCKDRSQLCKYAKPRTFPTFSSISLISRSCISGCRPSSYASQDSETAVVSYPAVINTVELTRISSSVRPTPETDRLYYIFIA